MTITPTSAIDRLAALARTADEWKPLMRAKALQAMHRCRQLNYPWPKTRQRMHRATIFVLYRASRSINKVKLTDEVVDACRVDFDGRPTRRAKKSHERRRLGNRRR